ncbi:DUF6074 family protein [Microvirga lenta]|uniref:DUF6074 family protein n=1 Tax=Microvirga lenta TaxID=2881337 RepID=UPI001CFF6A8F|nr:DUF6074 family protein [Microvirga lenta]
MSARVIPFPSVRRRSFVLRHAQHIASLSHSAGEKHLARQLKIQVDAMTRKGVAPELIEQERCALESAIRAELWSLVLTPGGAP